MAQDDYYYEIQLTNKQLVFYYFGSKRNLYDSTIARMTGEATDRADARGSNRRSSSHRVERGLGRGGVGLVHPRMQAIAKHLSARGRMLGGQTMEGLSRIGNEYFEQCAWETGPQLAWRIERQQLAFMQ